MSNHGVRAISAGRTLIIEITGPFDFSCQQAFRRAYEPVVASDFAVDLFKTTYIDSSALGLLLLLRETAVSRGGCVRLVNCSPAVKRVLSVANFQRLFRID